MADSEEELLQKEIAYYTNLLEKHGSLRKSDVQQQPFQSASWKQPVLPAYKLVKNTPLSINESKIQKSRKVILVSKDTFLNRNQRTVLYPTPKPNMSSQPFENNKIIKKRTVVNISNNTRTPVLIPKINDSKPVVASNSESQALLNEIKILDLMLKKSTKNSQICPFPSTEPYRNNTLTNPIVTHKNCIYKLTNLNTIKAQSVSRFKCAVNSRSNFNQKPNTVWTANTSKRKVVNQIPTNQASKPEKVNKMLHSLKEYETKQVQIHNNNNVSKTVTNSEKQNTLIKCISDLQTLKKVINPLSKQNNNVKEHPNNFVKADKEFVVTPTANKKTNTKNPSKYKVVNKHPYKMSKVKSPAKQKTKSPAVFKFKSSMTSKMHNQVYSKVNKRQSSSQVRQQSKSKFVLCKNATQKIKKVNSKYKVINKNIQNLCRLEQKNYKEQFLPSIPSPSVGLLDNSVIDNLEKRLLVVSASITSTPKPVTKKISTDNILLNSTGRFRSCSKNTHSKKYKTLATKYKVVNKNLTSKINSKVHIKKSPIKKRKVLSSKYKFVNKNVNTPKNISYKIKCTPKKEHSPTGILKPVKSVLVKRLFKSKNTIINKNDRSTSLSAKLIKSKYLGRNRKNLQKHAYKKVLPKFQKLGHYTSNVKLNRRFIKLNNSHNVHYNKRNIFSLSKLKRSNVVNVGGTRYSLSSSGRKLRRLPSKGQTRTNKMPLRMSFGRRPCTKTSSNVMKVASPPFVNIASRMLHLSINRALTASCKKSLTKINTYCMFYNRFGRCNRGVKCTYVHDPSKIAVCTRFLRGTCKVEGCPFSHEVSPGKMAICSFYLKDACNKIDCPYRHEQLSPNAILCKAFVQGYCSSGKECKKAHVLICPKFILGECLKGSFCAFPHPPQKEKKTAPKGEAAIEDKDIDKQEDILMEKIARYFQSLNEPSTSCNFFVPTRKKLEEQPSFIPLCGSSPASKEP